MKVKAYSPVALVAVDRETFVSTFLTVTLAPFTNASLASLTVPTMSAVFCALAVEAHSDNTTTVTANGLTGFLLVNMERPLPRMHKGIHYPQRSGVVINP
jgi:hypothetical protein